MSSIALYLFGRPDRQLAHMYFACATGFVALALGGTVAWLLQSAPPAVSETAGIAVVLVGLAVLYFVQDRDVHLAFAYGFGGSLIYFSNVARVLGEGGREDMAAAWPWLFAAGIVMVHRVFVFDRLGYRLRS